jgi:cytochrome c-type biogenesis protein CcmH/NrfG
MTLHTSRGRDRCKMTVVTSWVVALPLLLLSTATWSQQPAAGAGRPAPAVVKRDSVRCSTRADVDACYDAIRWSPDDPKLLVALGDALMRAQRPADAVRNYRRAAALEPGTRGISAKLNAAEAKLAGGPASAKRAVDRTPASSAPAKRYSNAAPEPESH